MSRRLAREAAMCLLYEREIRGEQPDESTLDIMRDVLQTDKIECKHGEYIESITKLSAEHREEIDEIIERRCTDWKLERLSRVDISILRLSVTELQYFPEIPSRVTINEAVELAKKFSQDKSPSFINGVLGAIVRDLDIKK